MIFFFFRTTIELENSANLTEDSNVSGGLDNSSFKTNYSESREINKNAISSQVRSFKSKSSNFITFIQYFKFKKFSSQLPELEIEFWMLEIFPSDF